MAINDDKRVIIFDTTLRDGEQALQSSLSPKQKLQIAMILDQLGVDVIEINQSPYTYMPKDIINGTLSVNGRGVNPCVGMTRRKNISAFDFIQSRGVFYHQRAGAKFGLNFADIPSTYGRSELGVFLYAIKDNIYFRDDFVNLFEHINAIEAEYHGGRDIGKDRGGACCVRRRRARRRWRL